LNLFAEQTPIDNGHLGRIMINEDFTFASQSKIIIPTMYREDNLGSLRKLTRRGQSDAYIRMMERIHAFSETVYDEDMDAMQQYLEQCNTFLEPEKGKLKFTGE